MRTNNDFKFFVPIEISKAKTASGEQVMKIGGIASTMDKDTDEEILDPNGFDLSYFLNQGYLNWNHQAKDNPAAIVGEPTKAEIRNNQLYIEGILYNENPLAQKVWDLANTIKKSSKKRSLGFSIEGKAIERGCGPQYLDKAQTIINPEYDPVKWKQIKRAAISGCAITPSPKNPSTVLDVLKGNATGFEDSHNELDFLLNDNLEATKNIIDITKPNGDRIVVDNNYSINIISKAMEASSISGTDTIDAETTGSSLKIESVDKNLKNLQKKGKKNNLLKNKNINFANIINKADLFLKLNEAFNDIQKAKNITEIVYNNLKELDMNNNNNEELVKALETLGVPADEISVLIKGKDKEEAKEHDEEDNDAPEMKNDDSSKEQEEKETKDKKDVVEDSKEKMDKVDEQPVDSQIKEDEKKEVEAKEEVKKEDDVVEKAENEDMGIDETKLAKVNAKAEKEETDKKEKQEEAKKTYASHTEPNEEEKMEKSEIVEEDIEKAYQDALEKAELLKAKIDEKRKLEKYNVNGDNTEFAKSLIDEFEKSNTATLNQMQELINGFNEFKNTVNEKLIELGNSPIATRKSVTNTFIEKSFNTEEQNKIQKGNTGTQMSISRDRARISNLLFTKSGIEKGENVNPLYQDAVMDFEATNNISKSVIDDLKFNHNIDIIA